MSSRIVDITAGLLLSIAVIGCAPTEPQTPHYDNTFWNVSSDPIADVEIDWDTNSVHFQQLPGRITPAVYHYIGKSMATAPYPIPDKVMVFWRTKDGKLHQQLVDVASRIPDVRTFKGSIVYQFTDQGVQVFFRTYAQQEQNVRMDKAAIP